MTLRESWWTREVAQIEVLYYGAFKKLGLTQVDLVLSVTLFGWLQCRSSLVDQASDIASTSWISGVKNGFLNG